MSFYVFVYHLAKFINGLCFKVRLAILLVGDIVAVFITNQLYTCIFHLYQHPRPFACVCPSQEFYSVVMARYQYTAFFFAIAFFVQFAILLLCIGANLTKLLLLLTCQDFIKPFLFD